MNMEKSTKIIMISVLTVASVIIALPFTPIRRSFKGITTNLTKEVITGLGVDLNGKIRNARMISKARQYEVIGLDLTNQASGKNRSFQNGTYGDIKGNFTGGGLSRTNITKGQHQGTAGGGGVLSSASSGSPDAANGSTGPTGIIASSSTTLKATGSTPRQKAGGSTYSPGNGATHPGLDPTGTDQSNSNPIGTLPVGDGTISLFILALGYCLFRVRSLAFRF